MSDICLSDICVAYGEKQVLSHLNLTLEQGKRTALVGPSGCGKTTLLRILAGLQTPDAGDVTGLKGKRVSCVFQENRLLPWLTVQKNVMCVLRGKKAKDTALHWLARMELQGEENAHPADLSGGMQRRVALARALAAEYDILLLDEPFTGIDRECKRRLIEEIRLATASKTVVLVTHDAEEVQLLADCRFSMSPLP